MAKAASPPRRAVVGLALATFLTAIETTIVGTAMPQVVASIGGLDLYPWAFSAYVLAATVAMPFYGRFADHFGVARSLTVAILVFLAGSMLCGASTSMPMLVACRVLQGLGAGGVTTVTLAAIGRLFPVEKRGGATALLTAVWGLSNLLGPVAGGLMVAVWPWQWIFWLNVPVGLAALLMIKGTLPGPGATGPLRLDAPGAALGVAGLAMVMGALVAREAALGALGVVGALCLLGWWRRERRSADPLVPLGLFSAPLFAYAAALGFLSSLTMYAVIGYVPLWVQGVMSRPAAEVGWAMVPLLLGWPVGGGIGGAIVNRAGFRWPVLAGCLLMALGFLALALPGFKTSSWELGLQAAIVGVGMGLVTAPTLLAGQAAVSASQLGAASSTLSLVRNLGGALGLNLLGGLQLAELARQLGALPPRLPGGLRPEGGAMAAGGEAMSRALASSLAVVFAAAFLFSLAALVLAWRMPAAPAPAAVLEAA